MSLAIVAALAVLVMLLLDASNEVRASVGWVSHSQHVIQTLDEAISELREAESGQRGFLLTGDQRFVGTFDVRLADVDRRLAILQALTSDNPVQSNRATVIHQLSKRRADTLRRILALAKGGRLDDARRLVGEGGGREQMEELAVRCDEFTHVERDLFTTRLKRADERMAWNRRLAVVGGTAVALLFSLLILFVTRGIRLPVQALAGGMASLGHGQAVRRIRARLGSSEFDGLARGYNDMADRLESAIVLQQRSEEQLQEANVDLLAQRSALQERGQVIETLADMANRLQAARTDDELAQIIRCFVPRVLPEASGALYAHNNSRNLLLQVASWGQVRDAPEGFAPNECWALRLGQSHTVEYPCGDILCAHADLDALPYRCEPLLAGGEIVGLLYIEARIEAEVGFRLAALAENIASALVNHRLQRNLREQTIRDPLTGLFNRRYMEETLKLEVARVARSGSTLSLVMCDVDHFKRFNDEFGHDAGDAVLQAVASEMRSHFRDGDVVCRFGGEEFTIIAPGATPAVLMPRVERLRQAITELKIRHSGRALGSLSMSFGVAEWHSSMARNDMLLVQHADAALYRAKREGRDRTIVADRLAA